MNKYSILIYTKIMKKNMLKLKKSICFLRKILQIRSEIINK